MFVLRDTTDLSPFLLGTLLIRVPVTRTPCLQPLVFLFDFCASMCFAGPLVWSVPGPAFPPRLVL